MVIPFDVQAAYVGWTSQGVRCSRVMRAFSRQGAAKGVSRLTAETVRGPHRIPVIPGSRAHQVG
jgi:hypothetical protein